MKAGVGRAVVTPKTNMWMAGYSHRDRSSEGKLHDLYSKALALEDGAGNRSVLVTNDLLGFPRSLSRRIASMCEARFGLPRERLMFSFSHTHSGPVLSDSLTGIYDLDEEQMEVVREYTESLPDLVLQAIEEALEDPEPCSLGWGIGSAGFAMNRRRYTVDGVINDINPIGPVDRDVPVLKVARTDGSLKAIAFGYACHNTTLSEYDISGDYAGFAQARIEEEKPGVTALYTQGCGADANPLPRGTIDLAMQYGRELGDAVLEVLESPMSAVDGPISAAYREVPLALTDPPSREEIERQLDDPDKYIRRRARSLLATMEEKGELDTTYPYPAQIWRFGGSMEMIALGGEVVVDYSLRLKHEIGRDSLWVLGYANDLMAYIPSLRVLREGGYEGENAMIYYGLHGPWAPEIEETIISAIREMRQHL